MGTTNVQFGELPPTVIAAVERRIGGIVETRPVAGGAGSVVSAYVETVYGRYYVKGLPADHPRAWTLSREFDVNPFVVPVSPRLEWRITLDGWDLLVFQYVDGRHADYSPGSTDLAVVADMMRAVGELPCLDVKARPAEERWARYSETPELFKGDHLLHTAWHPKNVLVSHAEAYLVGWTSPTKGGAWIDPACWVIWLMQAGHEPAAAERAASRVPAWDNASPEAVDAFAMAQANFWGDVVHNEPGQFAKQAAAAAQRWTLHRQFLR
ncbi:hypothetical protein AB0M95_39505 [Sphaerisporangium sp. NPDC051017]|uniref:hypothetical protein n=1 Tax=Sphaerisporangium sp. NPDC051017 TaxID=3154636 RepID=UPI00342E9CFB